MRLSATLVLAGALASGFTATALGHDPDALARDRIARLGELSDAQRKQIDTALIGLEVWTAAVNGRDTRRGSRAAGKRFAEMWAAGRVPTSDDHTLPFFDLMLDHAEAVSDADLFAKALSELEQRFGDKPDTESFFETRAMRLERLRAKADPTDDAPADDDAE